MDVHHNGLPHMGKVLSIILARDKKYYSFQRVGAMTGASIIIVMIYFFVSRYLGDVINVFSDESEKLLMGQFGATVIILLVVDLCHVYISKKIDDYIEQCADLWDKELANISLLTFKIEKELNGIIGIVLSALSGLVGILLARSAQELKVLDIKLDASDLLLCVTLSFVFTEMVFLYADVKYRAAVLTNVEAVKAQKNYDMWEDRWNTLHGLLEKQNLKNTMPDVKEQIDIKDGEKNYLVTIRKKH
jgi:hypothetical protein